MASPVAHVLTHRERRAVGALALLTVVAFVVREYAATQVGFGDSEALYASYALFPAPAYLDHPGLIGIVARAIGHGAAPSPLHAHELTAALMTLAPWGVVAACRALGAGLADALYAGLATAVAPEVAVGLFGMTPDLPLFFAWIATVACFGRALLSRPGSASAALLFVAAGLALGVGAESKVSALALVPALLLTLRAKDARPHARTLWPWASFALTMVLFAPVLLFEVRSGWPMARHRLIDTQVDAGVSLRNAGAIVLGQAAYVSPVLAVVGARLGWSLAREREADVVRSLLAAAMAVPLVILGLLCLWSRVAEPHWLAPAWLPLPLYYAVRGRPVRYGRAAVVTGLAMSAFAYAWVLAPGLVALVPAAAYDPRLDIANELYGWPDVARTVEATTLEELVPGEERSDVVVVGSVWMVCAQLRAALPKETPVACVGPHVADFATWAPKSRWWSAPTVVFVHDNRAPQDSGVLFPNRAPTRSSTYQWTRGGHVARTFTRRSRAR
jgi:hypothetical protein